MHVIVQRFGKKLLLTRQEGPKWASRLIPKVGSDRWRCKLQLTAGGGATKSLTVGGGNNRDQGCHLGQTRRPLHSPNDNRTNVLHQGTRLFQPSARST